MEQSKENQQIEIYENLAGTFCKKGMGEVLLFFLEAHRPLQNLTSQILLAFMPFFRLFLKKESMDNFYSIFNSQENYNSFLSCLDKKLKAKG